MDTFAKLTEDHQQLVHKFLKFSRGKRDIAVQSLQGEFNDLKSDRLNEEMYNQSDVEDIIDELCRVVKADVRQEVSMLINITSLLIKQLLEAADEQGATLSFDTSSVEDRAVLEYIENMRLDGPGGPAQNTRPNRLISIKDEHARLMDKNNELEESNRTLHERFTKLQGECSVMLKENSTVRRELRSLKDQMALAADEKRTAGTKAEFDSKRGAEEAEVAEELRRELERTRQLLAEAEEENAKKVNDTRQFMQLKKLLSTKNEQVVSLRRRLMEYEPDTGDTKHDDM